MVEPIVVGRADHTLSRRDIDPDALKVLYRLREANHVAYLVGGSVRDLLLGRRPKDFDIGTSAHPYQVKRLFRNCWIIGRRFRLAHVKFGQKVIEVATFRRQVLPGDGPVEGDDAAEISPPDLLIHHDNTFGTPEEDAFRRDFTVNALFYDIGTFSIIDYVGGLRDLQDRVVRAIGDPEQRFREDPVRMLRAIAFASRLDFTIDPPTEAAIRLCGQEIARSAPARLMEEHFKILRTGSAERTFRWLAESGLLAWLAPELAQAQTPDLWASLARLDAYRRRFQAMPETLTNPLLLGSLLVPLGFSARTFQPRGEPPRMSLGVLPLPRRDLERLRQVLALQPRLRDLPASPRAVGNLLGRGAFAEAVTWLDMTGHSPDVVAGWRHLQREQHPGRLESEAPLRSRRRRRRRPRGRVPQA